MDTAVRKPFAQCVPPHFGCKKLDCSKDVDCKKRSKVKIYEILLTPTTGMSSGRPVTEDGQAKTVKLPNMTRYPNPTPTTGKKSLNFLKYDLVRGAAMQEVGSLCGVAFQRSLVKVLDVIPLLWGHPHLGTSARLQLAPNRVSGFKYQTRVFLEADPPLLLPAAVIAISP